MLLNFNNANTQFEWIIILIQLVFSKEHRNTFSTFGKEQASNAIQKVEITNIKDPYSMVNQRIYSLNEFDDRLLLYRQHCTYISNSSSTKTMLNFSLNKEEQQATERRDFFTNQSSEKLYIDMRETLGYTGNKDSMKRDDSTIIVRITQKTQPLTI